MKKSTGKRLRELRIEKKWTLEEMANRVGRKKNTLSAIENDSTAPSRKLIEALSKELNVTTDYLLGLSEYRELDGQQSSKVREELERYMAKIEKMSEDRQKFILELMKTAIESDGNSK